LFGPRETATFVVVTSVEGPTTFRMEKTRRAAVREWQPTSRAEVASSERFGAAGGAYSV